MKLKIWLSLCLALLAVLASDGAWAHSRARVGIYVGPPALYWGPGWYPPPWSYPQYPPQVVVVPQAPPAPPPVYVEQHPAPAEQYWYYCVPNKAYYPYVKDCPEPWQRVLPQPEQR